MCAERKIEQPTITYKSIIDEILFSDHPISWQRIKMLDSSQIDQIAQRLLTEKNTANKEKLLRVFRKHKFPFGCDLILKFAKRRKFDDLKEHALRALIYFKDDRVREFALANLPRTITPDFYTDLLILNYHRDDHRLLSDIARKFTNEHIIHSITGSYIKIYEKNRTANCKEPLEILYSKLTCGVCRYKLVKILYDNNALSEAINNELKYDSYKETRKFAQSKIAR